MTKVGHVITVSLSKSFDLTTLRFTTCKMFLHFQLHRYFLINNRFKYTISYFNEKATIDISKWHWIWYILFLGVAAYPKDWYQAWDYLRYLLTGRYCYDIDWMTSKKLPGLIFTGFCGKIYKSLVSHAFLQKDIFVGTIESVKR